MSYTTCPACGGKWVPPGPCRHFDRETGEVCGSEGPTPVKPRPFKMRTVGQVAKPDRFALEQLSDEQVARNLAGLRSARAALAEVDR